jgi:glycerophosphoryl diester phosphodiesterase
MGVSKQRRRVGALGGLVAAATVAGSLATAPTASANHEPIIIAHRGDAQSAPESTIAAVKKAVVKGADAVEVDVRFSRTGYPMVLHDATLDRTTTNCSGPISRYSRVQLYKCDAGGWYSAQYRGEHIPKLDQVTRVMKWNSGSAKLLLHVKTLPTLTQAKRVANSVRMNGMMGRTVIIADADSILTRMKSVGFTERGRVFGSTAGWNLGSEYMLPLGVPLDQAAIRRIHARGGKVWPVESRGLSLSTLLGADSVDGILVNRLGSVLDLL